MKRQWRGGMAAFDFYHTDIGMQRGPAGSGAESRTVAPANSTLRPPAFRNAEFHPDAAVSGSGRTEIDLSAVSQGYVAVRAQSDKRLKCQVVYGDVKYNYDLPRRRNAGRLSAAKRQRAIQCPRDAEYHREQVHGIVFRTGGRCAGQ